MIDEVKATLIDYGKRITNLEINDARIDTKIEGLIKELSNLTTWIKALVMLMGSSLVGFFFWYIQGLK